MKLRVNYPDWATNYELKYGFITLMEEILLLAHNRWGKKFIKKQITEDEWEEKQEFIGIREKLIRIEKGKLRVHFKNIKEEDLPDWAKIKAVFTE